MVQTMKEMLQILGLQHFFFLSQHYFRTKKSGKLTLQRKTYKQAITNF